MPYIFLTIFQQNWLSYKFVNLNRYNTILQCGRRSFGRRRRYRPIYVSHIRIPPCSRGIYAVDPKATGNVENRNGNGPDERAIGETFNRAHSTSRVTLSDGYIFLRASVRSERFRERSGALRQSSDELACPVSQTLSRNGRSRKSRRGGGRSIPPPPPAVRPPGVRGHRSRSYRRERETDGTSVRKERGSSTREPRATLPRPPPRTDAATTAALRHTRPRLCGHGPTTAPRRWTRCTAASRSTLGTRRF